VLESYTISKDLKNNEALMAMNCIRIATVYLRTQKNLKEYEKFAQESLSIVENRSEIWAQSIKSQVYYIMSNYFLENYIMKPESKKSLDYAMKILEMHSNVNKSVESMINPPKEFPIFISFARTRIAKYYNVIGDFKSSLCYGSLKNKQMEKIYDANKMPIGNRLDVLIEEGHSLLWLKKNKEAEASLLYAFDTFGKIGVKSRAIRAVFYLIQARINLGKLEQAYNNCLDALSIKYESRNLYTLEYNTCYYHMAVIKYRQKDYALSLKHFSDFFRSMDKFCKGFLDKAKYDELASEKVFENPSDPAQVSLCFDNALKIFTTIYGSEHAFVKDYIAKKGKQDNWFSLFINEIIPISLKK
jgi:tetratricopeptide (TPR) repeat protein